MDYLTNGLNQSNNSINTSIDILKDNLIKKRNKQYSNTLYGSKAELYINDKYFDELEYKAKPILPLSFQPVTEGNKRKYSLYLNMAIDHYYENDPPSVIQSKWSDGILNLHLVVQKCLE